MSLNLEIAIRFIFSRKRSMLMSLAGIIFGVGFFIVTQAQTSGFERFYVETIIGTNSALRIEHRGQNLFSELKTGDRSPADILLGPKSYQKFIQGIEYPNRLREALEAFDSVTVVSEVLQGSVNAESIHNDRSGQINGIRLNDHLGATDLAQRMKRGSLDDFRANSQSLLIGYKLAQFLNVSTGDYIILNSALEHRQYIVAGIFETGVSDIDKTRIFMHLNEARSFLHLPFGRSIFQIAVKDPQNAREIAAHIEATLRHRTVSWQEREKTWLDVFKVLRISSALTVSSIILIAGLGIFNTLAMLALEKTREIAILRSMGYTRKDISRIFLWQGCIVLIAGILLGWAFGALVTYGISNLPIRITGIFTSDTFIVNWDPMHYIWAAVISFIIVMIASYFPSKKAARLEPGQIIRGTSL